MTAGRSYVALAALALFIAANVPAISHPSVIRAEPWGWVFPIRLHVGSQNGPVVDDAWIDASLANANQVFGAHGVQFEIRDRLTLDARRSRIETARDFLALPMLADRAQIDVFVVASLGLLPPLPHQGAPTGFCGPEFEGRITTDPKVLGNKPCVRGTRISVQLVLETPENPRVAHAKFDSTSDGARGMERA